MWTQAKSNRIIYEREKIKVRSIPLQNLPYFSSRTIWAISTVSARLSPQSRLKPPRNPTMYSLITSVRCKISVRFINLNFCLCSFCPLFDFSFFANLDLFVERQSDIQYQNRILLRKMLLIDHKHPKSVQKSEAYFAQPESNPRGLNAYNSLNKANRIVEMRKVATDNVSILNRLQNA